MYVINHLENITNHLKSNMDRFIVIYQFATAKVFMYLKSNMDRFIENVAFAQTVFSINLKSNMDRFIEIEYMQYLKQKAFKIQYG